MKGRIDMSKNILVMTGSPRKQGNSDMLAEAFIKGARQSGHTVNKYEAAFSKISGCHACDTCWSKGVPCSFDDDFNNKFVPLLEQADMLVLCMPLYFYGFPSGVQATLEKLYSLLMPQSKIKIKVSETMLLMCGGEKDHSIFTGAVGVYKQICKGMKWSEQEMILVPGVLGKGEIVKTDYLKQAEELGRSI